MKAICDECHMLFNLVSERVGDRKGVAQIDVRSCESGGVYTCEVVCPWCKHGHELLPD